MLGRVIHLISAPHWEQPTYLIIPSPVARWYSVGVAGFLQEGQGSAVIIGCSFEWLDGAGEWKWIVEIT